MMHDLITKCPRRIKLLHQSRSKPRQYKVKFQKLLNKEKIRKFDSYKVSKFRAARLYKLE